MVLYFFLKNIQKYTKISKESGKHTLSAIVVIKKVKRNTIDPPHYQVHQDFVAPLETNHGDYDNYLGYDSTAVKIALPRDCNGWMPWNSDNSFRDHDHSLDAHSSRDYHGDGCRDNLVNYSS